MISVLKKHQYKNHLAQLCFLLFYLISHYATTGFINSGLQFFVQQNLWKIKHCKDRSLIVKLSHTFKNYVLLKVSFEIAYIFPLENTKIGKKSNQDPSRSLEWLWKQRLACWSVLWIGQKWFLPPWLIFLSAHTMGPKSGMK